MEATYMRKRSNRRSVWLLIGLASIVLAVAAAYVVRTRTANQPSSAPEERTVRVTPGPYQVKVAGPGTLEAGTSLNLTVTAGLSGRIAEIAAVGDRVMTGDRLARLDPTAFERALKIAEFNLERAQAQLRSLESNQAQARGAAQQQRTAAEAAVATTERAAATATAELALVERLEALGAESSEALRAARRTKADADTAARTAQDDLSALRETQALQASARENDLTNAQLSVSQAELDLEEAQAALDSLTVTAPFSGVVSQANVVVGASVNDSTALLTLIDDATLSLVVQIDETQVGTIERGLAADVTLDALPGKSFGGSVTSVSPVARLESNIAIFDVIVTLPNANLEMRPGMTAEADIVVRNVPNAITVPTEALVRDADGVSLRAVTQEGATESITVEIVETVGFQSVVSGDFTGVMEIVVSSGAASPAGGLRDAAGGRIGLPGGRTVRLPQGLR